MLAPTQEQKQTYARDGGFNAKGFLSPAQFEQARACFDWGVANPGPRAHTVFPGTEHAHLNHNMNPGSYKAGGIRALIQEVPFVEYAAELLGSKKIWYFGEELFGKEGGKVGNSPWHQDHSVMPTRGNHWVNFWIPFEELPAKNCISIVRGSHRGKLYNGTAYTDPNDPTKPLHPDSDLPRLPDISADLARDPKSWDELSWDTKPGDVIVFHPCALHGGAPVDADTPNRHTLVLRFFGDDAVYSSLPNTDWSYLESQVDGAPFRAKTGFPELR